MTIQGNVVRRDEDRVSNEYMHACVWVHRHTFMCAHVEARGAFHPPASFSRQGLSLNLEFSGWPVWLAGEPQKSACLHLLPTLEFQVGATIDVRFYEA